jgi:hypothetical protein
MMAEDKELAKARKYYSDLKSLRSEILNILDKRDTKKISRAAKYYPERVNQLLIQRNIRSASVLFPFFDLAMLQERKQNMDLIDLNTPKTESGLLEDTVRRINREFEME